MGKAGYSVLEFRFVIEPELSQCYVYVRAEGDCPFGVQGWHHKTFPASKSLSDVVKMWSDGAEDPIMWPLSAPKET